MPRAVVAEPGRRKCPSVPVDSNGPPDGYCADRRVVTVDRPPAFAGFDLPAAYDAHGRELFGFAFNALRDRERAQECVQDVFLRAWRSRERFDAERATARTWLFAIMRNVVRDHLRGRAREPQTVLSDAELDIAHHDGDPTEWLVIVEALSTLSDEHRQAVIGIHIMGLSHAELADSLGVPVGTMRTRTFYALRALRRYFDEGTVQRG